VESTRTGDVVSRAGGFGGLFRVPQGFANPVMVSSADGVGTKLKVAMMADRHDTVGVDLVNHCVNDILVEGARPLFFLDYIGMGRLEQRIVEELVEGLALGCRENECVLLGGETAEMPDFYDPGEYDLAGFIVGMVDEHARPGRTVSTTATPHRPRVLGLPHQRLLAAAAAVLRSHGPRVQDGYPDSDESVADVLLRPHRSYARVLLPLIGDGTITALSHITGGGIPENLVRVLPDGCGRAHRAGVLAGARRVRERAAPRQHQRRRDVPDVQHGRGHDPGHGRGRGGRHHPDAERGGRDGVAHRRRTRRREGRGDPVMRGLLSRRPALLAGALPLAAQAAGRACRTCADAGGAVRRDSRAVPGDRDVRAAWLMPARSCSRGQASP
jgi:phosphoribosylaminoimidazole synthetase